MSRPGDRASKLPRKVVSAPFVPGTDHASAPTRAGVECLDHPESWSSAGSQLLPERESGDLGCASPPVVGGRQLR